jgi:hypothetical protein
MDDACRQTQAMIQANHENLRKIAEALLKYETLDVGDVKRILAGEELAKTSVGELAERERAQAAGGADKSPSPARLAPGAGPIPQPG